MTFTNGGKRDEDHPNRSVHRERYTATGMHPNYISEMGLGDEEHAEMAAMMTNTEDDSVTRISDQYPLTVRGLMKAGVQSPDDAIGIMNDAVVHSSLMNTGHWKLTR